MRDKKGLSAVITTLIMIALVIVLITIVWVAVDRMTRGAIEGSESCFDIAGKASINNVYTCWTERTGVGEFDELQFSVGLGDISPDSVLVTVSTVSMTKSYTIDGTIVTNVKNHDDTSYGTALTALTANSGQTYITKDFDGKGKPDSVELFLKFGEKQCSVSDALYEISDC
ncbi:MAG: hypothetical protein KJ566_00675 [Nanoarchaeota archaeon]|nr:hypothetical protein [Nanoarchaeota archaeon]